MTDLGRLVAVLLAVLGLGGTASAGRAPGRVTSIAIQSASGVTVTVTNPASVRRIVGWFDALPHFVARPCPYLVKTPADVRFTFLDASGAVVVNALDHLPGTCSGSVSYGRAGHVTLADDGFVAKVSRLLEVNFDVNAQTAANERAAKRDAARLLRVAIVPPGSRRARLRLSPLSSTPGVALAGRHRIWVVREPLASVAAFETAHRPHGSRLDESGTFGQWSVVTARDMTFSFPARPGRISSGELVVTMVARKHGSTGIRIDSEDVWIVARPPTEVVPAGVREIDFGAGRTTSPAEVATIVRWFDKLPIGQPSGPHSCPALTYGPVVTLDFRGSAGTLLARAQMPMGLMDGSLVSTSCTPIEVTIGGLAEEPLIGGKFFIRVERLLGVNVR